MAGTTGAHDVGGLDAESGQIDVGSGSKKYKLWEIQTHCLVMSLYKKGYFTVDEVRFRCTCQCNVLTIIGVPVTRVVNTKDATPD